MVPASLLPEGAPPTFLVVRGSHSFKSETVHALELGYRLLNPGRYTIDVTSFYNRYGDLRDVGLDPSVAAATATQATLPFVLNNTADGRTFGFEAAADLELARWWRLHATYAFLDVKLDSSPGGSGNPSDLAENGQPDHQLGLRSHIDLRRQWQLDAAVRYTDELKGLDIAAFWELDLRLGWEATRHLEVSILGRNLLHDRHAEFLPQVIESVPAETERSASVIVTWRG
jgi:iron complex outermembrane receptor protein